MLKGAIRSRQLAAARNRMMADVLTADVVLVNPTHVAVALRYAKGDAAPVVVAKGHDAMALQIRSEARRHGVPILENRRLARALDAEVQIGRMVPGKHFAAVAHQHMRCVAFRILLHLRPAQLVGGAFNS